MKKMFASVCMMFSMMVGSANASLIQLDLADVTGNVSNVYSINIPSVGTLVIEYLNSAGNSVFEANGDVFVGGPNFVMRNGNQIKFSALGFDFSSITFSIWDLDTVSSTERVTFNGGNELIGVNFNVLNSVAHLQNDPNTNALWAPPVSATIAPDQNGEIVVAANWVGSGGGFAIGGLSVNVVPEPSMIAMLAMSLLFMRRFRHQAR